MTPAGGLRPAISEHAAGRNPAGGSRPEISEHAAGRR